MACARVHDGVLCGRPADEFISQGVDKAPEGDWEFFVGIPLCQDCYAELKELRRKHAAQRRQAAQKWVETWAG